MWEINWYHVFNATTGQWLAEDGEWSSYRDAEEFGTIEEAQNAAKEQLRKWKAHQEPTLTILGDLGSV